MTLRCPHEPLRFGPKPPRCRRKQCHRQRQVVYDIETCAEQWEPYTVPQLLLSIVVLDELVAFGQLLVCMCCGEQQFSRCSGCLNCSISKEDHDAMEPGPWSDWGD